MKAVYDLNLLTREVQDPHAQENFRRLSQFHAGYLFKNFKVVTIDVRTTGVDVAYAHGLDFKPEDAVITYISDPSTVAFNYSLFTDKVVVLQSSAVCRVKFLIGKF